MIYPAFQRVRLRDGRVVIVKTDVVCEVDKSDAQKFEKAAEQFKKNWLKYHAFNGDRKRIVAGILLDFDADKFARDDVLRWCAFAGENFTLEEISSALNQLQRDTKHPMKLISEKGPNARWQVQKDALASYHR